MIATPHESQSQRESQLDRIPNLLMGIVALFGVIFLASVYWFPQQTYSEYAARWNLFLGVLAAIALVGVAIQWLVPAPLFALAPLCFLPLFSWVNKSWVGVDWESTALQGALALLIGMSLGLHFGLRGQPGKRTLACGLFGLSSLLLLIQLGEMARQHFVLFAEQISYLQSLPSRTEKQELLLDALQQGRLHGRLGNPNLIAAFICMLWPILFCYYCTSRRAALQWTAAVFLFGLAPLALYFTSSRGGILTALATVSLSGLILWKHLPWRRLMLQAGALLAALVILSQVAGSIGEDAQNAGEEEISSRFSRPSTLVMRKGFLKSSLDMVQGEGLWGQGGGTFEILYLRYRLPGIQETKFAHNWPLHVLIELGVQGLVALLGLIAIPLIVSWRQVLFKNQGDSDTDDEQSATSFEAILPKGLLIAWVIFWFNGLFEISLHQRELFLLICLLIGALQGWLPIRRFTELPLPSKAWSSAILAVPLIALGWQFWWLQPLVTLQSNVTALRQGPYMRLESRLSEGQSDRLHLLWGQLLNETNEIIRKHPGHPAGYQLMADSARLASYYLQQQVPMNQGLIIQLADLAAKEPALVEKLMELQPWSASQRIRLADLTPDQDKKTNLYLEALRLHLNSPDVHVRYLEDELSLAAGLDAKRRQNERLQKLISEGELPESFFDDEYFTHLHALKVTFEHALTLEYRSEKKEHIQKRIEELEARFDRIRPEEE
jgi:hypothetical protein